MSGVQTEYLLTNAILFAFASFTRIIRLLLLFIFFSLSFLSISYSLPSTLSQPFAMRWTLIPIRVSGVHFAAKKKFDVFLCLSISHSLFSCRITCRHTPSNASPSSSFNSIDIHVSILREEKKKIDAHPFFLSSFSPTSPLFASA